MKKKNRWWLLITPLYLFTLLFVLGPMIYMVAVSFATNNGDGYGFRWIFTLDNYRKMTDPVYLQCFVQSFELAFATTILVDQLPDPPIRLDHHSAGKRNPERHLKSTRSHRQTAETPV